MDLTPMRFKNFVWPHNPRVYSIDFERKMAVNKIPFGRHLLQSLGQTRRVFRGEGEFVGADAYDTFKALAVVFQEETPGALIHPVWMTTRAWFVSLRLEEEPRADYVRYSFEFWEAPEAVKLRTVPTARTTEQADIGETESVAAEEIWYTVVRGDTLWAIAKRYDTTVAAITALNPTIRNPNLILPGQEVRVR